MSNRELLFNQVERSKAVACRVTISETTTSFWNPLAKWIAVPKLSQNFLIFLNCSPYLNNKAAHCAVRSAQHCFWVISSSKVIFSIFTNIRYCSRILPKFLRNFNFLMNITFSEYISFTFIMFNQIQFCIPHRESGNFLNIFFYFELY